MIEGIRLDREKLNDSQSLRTKLYSFYSNYNEELAEWLGEDWGWNSNLISGSFSSR